MNTDIDEQDGSSKMIKKKKHKKTKHNKKHDHQKKNNHPKDDDNIETTDSNSDSSIQYNKTLRIDEAETEKLKDKLLEAVLHPNSSHFDLQGFLHQQEQRVEAIVKSVDYKKIDTWKNQVMDSSQYGESFLRFTITTIICFGGVLNLLY